MSLMFGRGPFGRMPAGQFNAEVGGKGLVYAEPFPRRLRARVGGETVVDSRRAQLLFEQTRLPIYVFPREDVRWDLLGDLEPVDAPVDAVGLEGYVGFPWDSMDAWLEEDDEVVGHAPDPYHRIDVRDTSRHVRVSLNGETLAESTRARVLFETGLPPRWYFPREDVVAELERSDLTTTCAYKGHASYWSARVAGELRENLAWFYPEPRRDGEPVIERIAFFNEQVDIEVDGERQERPGGPWAHPGWWRQRGPVR